MLSFEHFQNPPENGGRNEAEPTKPLGRRAFLKRLGGAIGAGHFAHAKAAYAGARFIETLDSPKDKGEHAPQITLEFFFGAHGNAEDLAGAREAIHSADGYIMELAGHDAETRAFVRAVARGDRSLDEHSEERADFYRGEFMHQLLSSIADTKQPVFFADLPYGESYRELMMALGEAIAGVLRIAEALDTREILAVLQEFRERAARAAQLLRARDGMIIKRLEALTAAIETGSAEHIEHAFSKADEIELDYLRSTAEDLHAQKEVRLASFYGVGHTELFRQMRSMHSRKDNRKRFASVKQEFPARHLIVGYQSETLRRFYFNRPVSDEHLLRDLFEGEFTTYVVERLPAGSRSDQFLLLLRRIAEQFTTEEVQGLLFPLAHAHREYATSLTLGMARVSGASSEERMVQASAQGKHDYTGMVERLLTEKQFAFPQSLDELERLADPVYARQLREKNRRSRPVYDDEERDEEGFGDGGDGLLSGAGA